MLFFKIQYTLTVFLIWYIFNRERSYISPWHEYLSKGQIRPCSDKIDDARGSIHYGQVLDRIAAPQTDTQQHWLLIIWDFKLGNLLQFH